MPELYKLSGFIIFIMLKRYSTSFLVLATEKKNHCVWLNVFQSGLKINWYSNSSI